MENKTKNTDTHLNYLHSLDEKLFSRFKEILSVDGNLNRQLVSFQANKERTAYRWYKYKEAFSASLVEYLLSEYNVPKGIVFDPFAGSGTTLLAASEAGYDAEGIELLPLGQQIIRNRIAALSRLTRSDIDRIRFWKDHSPWKHTDATEKINTLRITSGAYPQETEKSIENFLAATQNEKETVREMLFFAVLCILESVSYTRKDGQYLRWDYRAGRKRGQHTFDKGRIYPFDEAITSKLDEIINDLDKSNIQLNLFADEQKVTPGNIRLYPGSCIEILPELQSRKYGAIITSPPYCNRYDYTRTYALEHALAGIQEAELIDLRQNMLSCTVENREKDLLKISSEWKRAIHVCEESKLLQSIIAYLEHKKSVRELNNNGIPRMVRGYFYETACVIQECFRILETNGIMFMVNDNVRYAGVSISVDLILSQIAESLGFNIESIRVLPDGKGNSSQQMGIHGRDMLRKSVYVWQKMN